MRGVLGHAVYIPYRRLDRSTIAVVAGSGGGKGTRSVASYDEDTTTMGFEAARVALRGSGAPTPTTLTFATTSPAYLDRTNATAIHAALRLPRYVLVSDAIGSSRSAVATLRSALEGTATHLVVGSDLRSGLPGSADEATGGDAASAIVVGDGPGVAAYLGGASATEEFLDRWRTPGDPYSKVWEERFGEGKYVALGTDAWEAALKQTGVVPTRVVVAGSHARAVGALATKLGSSDTATDVGWTGAAHPGLLLSQALTSAQVGDVVALVSLSDGADVLVFRVNSTPPTPEARRAGPISYGKFLAWRGVLPVEPPRRPDPARVSAAAAGRSIDWKFGFVGSRAPDGAVHLPPTPLDDERIPMADATGTVVTFTVDKLAYSPSPPIVFAVVDFDGGGRLPVELTDVDPGDVSIGMRVEPTFRRLSTADGIHNYFWKVRPVA